MELKTILKERRAVNFFDPEKPVPEEDLKQILETAALAPTGFNLQPYNVIIFRNKADKERLMKLANDQPKIAEAPVTVMVLADRDGWHKGHPTVEKVWEDFKALGYMGDDMRGWFDNAREALYSGDEKSLAFAVKNAAFFGMAVMLAAKDMGYDTHPMDGFDHGGVKKEFDIPDNYWIPMLIAVGKFDESKTLLPPKWRKSYDEMVIKTY